MPSSRHLQKVLMSRWNMKGSATDAHCEVSNVFTSRVMLVKEVIASGFIASTVVIYRKRQTLWWRRESFRRLRIRGINYWTLQSILIKIGVITKMTHKAGFKRVEVMYTIQNRKLSAVWAESKRCWTAFIYLWLVASKGKIKRHLCIE